MFANVWHFPHMCGKSHWHAYFRLSYLWIFLEIAWQDWPFKIGLSLFDFKQLLVNSGIIVHWTKSSRSWEQKTLIFNSNNGQKISKVWHVQDTRRTSRHLPDIDQSFSNNASHRGNNSQIRAGLVCETLHYLHQIPFSLHCRHNRHCRATYVAAWPTVQHEKQYKSSQNDLHLCLFACEPNF